MLQGKGKVALARLRYLPAGVASTLPEPLLLSRPLWFVTMVAVWQKVDVLVSSQDTHALQIIGA